MYLNKYSEIKGDAELIEKAFLSDLQLSALNMDNDFNHIIIDHLGDK